jgi:FKBP-type peptidyl-prolyl cis-trans isomerase FkpA
MKSLFKVTLLATALSLTFGATQVLAADDAKTAPAASAQPATTPAAQPAATPAAASADPTAITVSSQFKGENEQIAYALGAYLAREMDNTRKDQEQLGFKLDKDSLVAGAQDAFAGKNKLSDEEIEKTLQAYELRIRKAAQEKMAAAQAKMEQDAKDNADKGDKFRAEFAKQKGVKKTESGVLYLVDKPGNGASPKDSDTVVVNYKGTLIDGTEFDSSYTRGEPLSFRLGAVIPGWREGLKHIKKGGSIKLVIPPELAYGKTPVPHIPANSTLVFNVELLDVKAAEPANGKADDKKAEAAGVKSN